MWDTRNYFNHVYITLSNNLKHKNDENKIVIMNEIQEQK